MRRLGRYILCQRRKSDVAKLSVYFRGRLKAQFRRGQTTFSDGLNAECATPRKQNPAAVKPPCAFRRPQNPQRPSENR
ncbi:TPA: hypothetical protein ACFP4Y_001316 [Neisseria bacilliformis]